MLSKNGHLDTYLSHFSPDFLFFTFFNSLTNVSLKFFHFFIRSCSVVLSPTYEANVSAYKVQFKVVLQLHLLSNTFHAFSFALVSLKDWKVTFHSHTNFLTVSISFSGKSSFCLSINSFKSTLNGCDIAQSSWRIEKVCILQ